MTCLASWIPHKLIRIICSKSHVHLWKNPILPILRLSHRQVRFLIESYQKTTVCVIRIRHNTVAGNGGFSRSVLQQNMISVGFPSYFLFYQLFEEYFQYLTTLNLQSFLSRMEYRKSRNYDRWAQSSVERLSDASVSAPCEDRCADAEITFQCGSRSPVVPYLFISGHRALSLRMFGHFVCSSSRVALVPRL